MSNPKVGAALDVIRAEVDQMEAEISRLDTALEAANDREDAHLHDKADLQREIDTLRTEGIVDRADRDRRIRELEAEVAALRK